MRSRNSSVAGWLVPARGTCSRKLSSPSVSIRQTRISSCANASDRHRPTGPAPMTITRSEARSIRQVRLQLEKDGRSGLRYDILSGADPAFVGEVEDDASRVLVLGLVVGVFGGRTAFEIAPAGVEYLLLRLVQVINPHSKMVEARLLVWLLLEQRDVDHAVGEINAAARGSGTLQIERLFKEFRRRFRVRNDQRDVTHLGHVTPSCALIRDCRQYRPRREP